MNRAVVTFATGAFDELLDIAWPGYRSFADRHGYDLLDAPPKLLVRPPSWGKLVVVLDALASGYDEVVWIDCDCVILDDSLDLADEVADDDLHAITRHRTREGEIPSCGLWLVRPGAQPYLEGMWRLTKYLHHPWWEQAALHQLLGYGGTPVARLTDSPLYDRTHWLPPEWHAIELQYGSVEYPDGESPAHPRIVHAGPGSDVAFRASLMRELLGRRSAALIEEGV